MKESEALGVLEKVLRLTDAEAAVASIEGGTQAATRVADNVITQNVERSSVILTVSCAYGQSHGAASTDDLKPESLKAVVKAAQAIARSMPADPEYMPPLDAAEAKRYALVDSFFEQTVRLDPLEKAEQIVAAIRTVAGKRLRLSGAYATGGRFQAVANSAGLRGYHRTTGAEIHVTVLGKTGSGWAEQISNNAQEIEVERVASEAVRISELSEDPVDLAPGKYTVIMRPAALGEMLAFAFWGGIDAKATDEGRTCMRGKLGTKVCGEQITIRSDPADSHCPGPPFQEEGLALPALPWVEKGVLKNLSYSRFWAKRQGKAPTGFPSNVIMDGGTATVDGMIAGTGRGLLITRFWYIRYVDPMVPLLTGMTRDGLFLIEDGKITRPVKHMRFNEDPLDALNRVEAMGPPERTGEYIGMLVPTLKMRDFNFTSATRF